MRPSTINTAFAALPALLFTHATAIATPVPDLALNAMTYKGCFTTSDPLSDQGSYLYQTSGYCQPICVGQNKPVMGLSGGSNCWCGDLVPAANSLVDDAQCNSPCDGYDKENCGGTNTWSVYLTGLNKDNDIPNFQAAQISSSSASPSTTPSPTSKPSASTTAVPSVVTVGGSTVVLTVSSQPTSTPSNIPKPSSSPNKAGIAAGVVVGLIVIAAIVGGMFLFLKRRKRLAVEEEYKRSAAVESFISGGKVGKPQTNDVTMVDARVDPFIMASRRQSDGSLADDADYSRRILKVTNPDGN